MNDKGNGKRSAYERFGGGQEIVLPDGRSAYIGEVIMWGGRGKGFEMLPSALDHYERVMRLSFGEAALLRRMMAHAWEYGTIVFLSLSKIALEADISRRTLGVYMKRLVERGYVHLIAEANGGDRRKRYDVSPAFRALALCIMLDPCSDWNRRSGEGTVSPRPEDLIEFDLDLDALFLLNRWNPDEED